VRTAEKAEAKTLSSKQARPRSRTQRNVASITPAQDESVPLPWPRIRLKELVSCLGRKRRGDAP
jgi:hypothetical protein